MKAIIYARVSTEEQKRKGYSIEAQLEACRNCPGPSPPCPEGQL